MSKRKIKKKIKKRRPRAGHARTVDAQNRAAAAAFHAWAIKPRDRDESAVDEIPTKAEAAACVEQTAEEVEREIAQELAEGETLDEMSDEFDARKYADIIRDLND